MTKDASNKTGGIDRDASRSRDKNGRFMPGHPGNPKGRPPAGFAMTDILRKYLDLPLKTLRAFDLEELPAKDAIAIRQILDGTLPESMVAARSREYSFDRLDGRPKQATELTGAEGGPIETVYVGVPRRGE